MEALTEVVRSGKARYIGFSEWTAPQIQASLDLSASDGWTKFVSSQPQYSLLWREPEARGDPALPGERHLADRLVAARPGRADRQVPAGRAARPKARARRASGWARMMGRLARAGRARAGAAARPIAERLGITMAQLALAWVLREENVASAIVGASRPEQVHDNAAASAASSSTRRRSRRSKQILSLGLGAMARRKLRLAERGRRACRTLRERAARTALERAARRRERSRGRRRGLARRGARHAALGAAARRAAGLRPPVRLRATSSRVDAGRRATLREAEEIELERESARLWHWRARTTELQAAGERRAARALRDVRPAGRRDRDARLRAGRPAGADARRLPRLRQGLPPPDARAARRGALDRGRAPPRAELALRRGEQLGRRPARHLISTSLLSRAHDQRIERYADLIVRVGANVQPGQTVFVTALVEHAPLVRAIGRVGLRRRRPPRRRPLRRPAPAPLVHRARRRRDADRDARRGRWRAPRRSRRRGADHDRRRSRARAARRPRPGARRQGARDRRDASASCARRTSGRSTGRSPRTRPRARRCRSSASRTSSALWEAVAHSVRLDEADPVAAWRAHIGPAARALPSS